MRKLEALYITTLRLEEMVATITQELTSGRIPLLQD